MTIRLVYVAEHVMKYVVDVGSMFHWFQINFMHANLSKFQFMLFGKNRDECNVELAPDVTLVPCPSVHLLGVTLDCTLSFTDQILNLCKRLVCLSQDLDVKSKFYNVESGLFN